MRSPATETAGAANCRIAPDQEEDFGSTVEINTLRPWRPALGRYSQEETRIKEIQMKQFKQHLEREEKPNAKAVYDYRTALI